MNYAHIFIDLIVIVLVILSCNILCKLCETIHSFCKNYTVMPDQNNDITPTNTHNNDNNNNNDNNDNNDNIYNTSFDKKNYVIIKNPYNNKLCLGIESAV
jgi:hypothetical protein